jgi:hypothetical protein
MPSSHFYHASIISLSATSPKLAAAEFSHLRHFQKPELKNSQAPSGAKSSDNSPVIYGWVVVRQIYESREERQDGSFVAEQRGFFKFQIPGGHPQGAGGE